MYKNWKPPQDSSRLLVPSRANVSTIFNKKGREVQTRNYDTYTLAMLLDWDVGVSDFVGQPRPVEYRDAKGHLCTYYPDFEVFRTNGSTELHTVINSATQQGPNFQYILAALNDDCVAHNSKLFIHSEHSLPNRTVRVNLNSVRGFRAKSYARQEVIVAVQNLVQTNSSITISEVTQLVATQTQASWKAVHNTVGFMLWHHMLRADLTKLIYVDGRFEPHVKLTRE